MNIELSQQNLFDLQKISVSTSSLIKNIRLLDKLIFSEPIRFKEYAVDKKKRMNEDAQKALNAIKIDLEDLNTAMYSLKLTPIEIDIDSIFESLINKRDQYENKLSKMSIYETNGMTLENIDSNF